jgi:hypothetical protein
MAMTGMTYHRRVLRTPDGMRAVGLVRTCSVGDRTEYAALAGDLTWTRNAALARYFDEGDMAEVSRAEARAIIEDVARAEGVQTDVDRVLDDPAQRRHVREVAQPA